MSLNAYIPPAKRGPLIVDPKQRYTPNFKFHVADTDFIVGLANAGRTAVEISERCRRPGWATVEQIKRICWESGVNVRQI